MIKKKLTYYNYRTKNEYKKKTDVFLNRITATIFKNNSIRQIHNTHYSL